MSKGSPDATRTPENGFHAARYLADEGHGRSSYSVLVALARVPMISEIVTAST